MKRDILKYSFEKKKSLKSRMNLYQKKPLSQHKQPDVPKGLYEQCLKCKSTFPQQEALDNMLVCPKCQSHFRIRAIDRISMTADPHTFVEKGFGYITLNPLFQEGYEDKIGAYKKKTNLDEAFIYGYAEIKEEPCIIGVMDSYFMMGSMGSVVGEKVTKAIEYALYKKLPLILFIASGGARMQEGIYSLMQMAKTSGAVKKLHRQGLLYISVLTDPTTGGVTASFASLGDIILAEPGALIGFAGPRVIEQTIKQKLPEDFQRAEFLLDKGMIDKVVHRHEMRDMLSRLLIMHKRGV
ncbi:MAG: acetyl-CoA carboxylase, carboxyltransferase subunit beta [Candidatus Izemoplasmataceae bacterium]